MGEAAKISLKAIGKEDTHLLSKDPEDSFFNYETKRHSDFRKYHRARNVVNNGTIPGWPFGQTVKVQFNPTNMGDILSNMWISINMPGLNGTTVDYFDVNKYEPNDFITEDMILYGDHVTVTGLVDDGGFLNDDEFYDEPIVFPANKLVYGYSIALSGDGKRLVVGSPKERKIYVYRLEKTIWIKEDDIQYERDSGNEIYHHIGTSVSIDYYGTKIATVIPYEDSYKTQTNTILVFERDVTTNQWLRNSSYVDIIQPVHSDIGDGGFVFRVSLSSDGMQLALGLMGSFKIDTYNNRLPGTIIYTLDATFNSSRQVIDTQMGCFNSVKLSGDGRTLIVSSMKEYAYYSGRDENGLTLYRPPIEINGGAKIYKYDNGSWTQTFSHSITDGFCSHGVSINRDGTRAAFGLFTMNSSNELEHKVRVLDYNSTWQNTHDIQPNSTSFVGYSLDMTSDGNELIIGDILTINQLPKGYDIWDPLPIFGEDILADGSFEENVSAASVGGKIPVSATNLMLPAANHYPNTGSGAAYIYKYENNAWVLNEEIVDSQRDKNRFGFSVSVDDSGKKFVIGEPIKQNPAEPNDAGKVAIVDKITKNESNYADQLGRHILKSVTMYVDELEVEKIHDDWSIIYDELYLEMSEKVANQYMVNRNLNYDTSTNNPDIAHYETRLMIPLHFFFSRKYSNDEYATNKPNRPYFPTCAIHKQNIIFEFEFHNQTFFTGHPFTIGLNDFKLITEEITISPEERTFLINTRQTLTTDIVKKHPSILSEEGVDIIHNNLVPDIPVKCIHWFLRNTEFEKEDDAIGDTNTNIDENLYFHNRFNFSKSPNFDEIDTFFNPVMDSASFFLNGNKFPNITVTDHNYFKYLIPFKNRLSRPYRNIYTYSFSMNPINVEPSGNLDFSQLNSDKTLIELKLADTSKIYSLHIYYTGYQTFVFDRGFMSLAY
jgi:hypothetical protein